MPSLVRAPAMLELFRWEDDSGAIPTLERDHSNNRLTCSKHRRELRMKWVTRERPKVDRVACPWLIKRFVDPEAEFLYAPANQVHAVAEREGATPYDVPGAELGHHGAECSFDAIVRKYHLDCDPAVQQLASIVRGADTDQRDLTPESRGLLAIAQGFSAAYPDDHAQLAAELPLYDALYAWCRTQRVSA